MTTKVTLRRKPMSKGMESLYLDFYPPIQVTGKDKTTRREFLKLHIYAKPKNPLHKQSNKQTLILAEQIRIKRENELNKSEIYTDWETEKLEQKKKGKLSFVSYFEKQMDKKEGKKVDFLG